MTLSLVTGGSGFIGRHLVEKLLARGDDVRVLDLDEPRDPILGVAFVRGSVTDRAAMEAALADVDCIYHLAGIAHFWRPRMSDLDIVNRIGTETVLAAAAAAGTPRIVHCSTEAVLLTRHRTGAPIDESAEPRLEDMAGPYTRSKYLAEQAAMKAAREGADVVVVNPTVPIGAGDHNMTPPAQMLAMFLTGNTPFFLDCVLNLAAVDDIADGIALAGRRGQSGERYILGGENLALRELLSQLEALSGRRMPRRAVPPRLALATGVVGGWIADHLTRRPPAATREGVALALRSAPFDCNKAKRELGYGPRPIRRALGQVVEGFMQGGQNRARKRWLSAF